jgi:hypothetical protein
MHNPKTDSQQVPLEAADEPERDETQSPQSGRVSCVICGCPVSLEDCKLDEQGDPVHDHCYFESLSRPNRSDENKPRPQS